MKEYKIKETSINMKAESINQHQNEENQKKKYKVNCIESVNIQNERNNIIR